MTAALLATSNTLPGIIECISKFWLRKDIRVEGERVYLGDKLHERVRVIKKKGRYRFEMLDEIPGEKTAQG